MGHALPAATSIDVPSDGDPAALAIDRPWEPCATAEQLELEREIFDGMARSPQRLRLWQPLPALVATSAEAHRPEFALAVARSGSRGLPVHVRASGGGAVCVGPGSLIVSHFYHSSRNDIDASYRRFAGSLIQAMAALGISLTEEHVVGAYCDGRYDLAWQGRKVAGIAQRRRLQNGTVRLWIHAVLAVTAQSQTYPQAVSAFYADLGSSRMADPTCTTTLSHCLPAHATSHELLSRVGDAVVHAFKGRPATGA